MKSNTPTLKKQQTVKKRTPKNPAHGIKTGLRAGGIRAIIWTR